MMRFVVVVLGVLAAVPPAAAQERPLICFGNEPSWAVDLTTPGSAKLSFPGEDGVTYRGVAVRNEPLREWLWRGTPAAGRDLVVFLREGECSDGMSDGRPTRRSPAASRSGPCPPRRGRAARTS